MTILVVIEHDNNTIKQSSLSTISAAKKIEDNVEAIILGKDMNSAVNDLKKCDHLKRFILLMTKCLRTQ